MFYNWEYMFVCITRLLVNVILLFNCEHVLLKYIVKQKICGLYKKKFRGFSKFSKIEF